MKKDVYLENVEKTIKNQIKWQKFENEIETIKFLGDIAQLLIKLYDQAYTKLEQQK